MIKTKKINDIECQAPIYCHRLVPMTMPMTSLDKLGYRIPIEWHHKKLEYMHSELPGIVNAYWVCKECKVIDRMRSVLYDHRLESFQYYDARPKYEGIYKVLMSTEEEVLVFVTDKNDFLDSTVIIKLVDDDKYWDVDTMGIPFLYRLRYKLTQGIWMRHPFGSDVDSSELMSEVEKANSTEEYKF